MPFINCADATLASYSPNAQKEWNKQRAIHLYRRISFGANLDTLNDALNQNPTDLVKKIVSDAVALPPLEEPEWAYWQLSDYDPDPDIRNEQLISQILGLGNQWIVDMQTNGLRDRMSWFWHNHFVTRQDDYGCPSWMYQYHHLLQKYALGNFKDFVYDMGITPAMLVFLNGVQNIVNDPNENYARELYELFTLGVDNGYTQNDIVETARALTGWNGLDVSNFCGEVTFLPFAHDQGVKTIFGQSGNWGYDDVVNILFQQRGKEISEFICSKLYKHFINPREDMEIIEGLAQTFRDNNWEIAPVLEQMFCSEHFFDIAHIGTVIPGHVEYFLNFINEMNYPPDPTFLYNIVFIAGDYDQRMFNPTNVAGWPGNRNWINSSSLPLRWQGITDTMGYFYALGGESIKELKDIAIGLTSDIESDPEVVTRALIDHFLPKGLQFEFEYEEALEVFKAEVPDNYFDSGQWNLQWEYAPAQVFYLLTHIANLPEFQLK